MSDDVGDVSTFSRPSLPISVYLDREASPEKIIEGLREDIEQEADRHADKFLQKISQIGVKLGDDITDYVMSKVRTYLTESIPEGVDKTELVTFLKNNGSEEDYFGEMFFEPSSDLSLQYYIKFRKKCTKETLMKALVEGLDATCPWPVSEVVLEEE